MLNVSDGMSCGVSTVAQLISAAANAHAKGNLQEASNLCRQVLDKEPHHLQAQLLSGVVLIKSGNLVEGIPFLENVSGRDPSSFQSRLWLSIGYRKCNRLNDALKAGFAAVQLNPNDAQGQSQLGSCYLDLRSLTEAEDCFRKAINLAPSMLPIHCSLVHTLKLQGKHTESVEMIRRVLANLRPTLEVLIKYGNILLADFNGVCAAEFGRRAVLENPDSPEANVLLGRALLESDFAKEAIEYLRAAVKLQPENFEAVATLASAIQSTGDISEASALFQRSLKIEPNQAQAYFGLFHNKKANESDWPYIDSANALIEDSKLPKSQLRYLHYALGKANEDLGDYETSMHFYDLANDAEYNLKFGDREFDEDSYRERFSGIAKTFSSEFMRASKGNGSGSDLPIFVVGMMRSGTTLAEQILSSHPSVGAAGEQNFWPDNWRKAMTPDGTQANPKGIAEAAETYVQLLRALAPGKERVVDKMPTNYAGLGVIHLAFPKAKIIHMVRHPVDTCLSIYSTPNRAQPEFAHNRANIVFAYQQYLALMDHWRSVLPAENFYEVDYEELCSDTEAMTRKLIEFVGLEWDDCCLKPQDNVRSVVTPSVWQVRQPIYRSSMGRWRKFEPWLGEFSALLPAEPTVKNDEV